MDKLVKGISKISVLSPEIMTVFVESWKQWDLPRDHLLLREKAVSEHIYFLEKGAIRIFYHKNDKEVTEWIAMDEQFFLSITSFFERQPSRLIIQTIEPSVIWGIHYSDLMQLAAQYHPVETLFRKMMTGSLILSQQRMDSIQFESAQQRYDHLLEKNPAIIQRIPLSYIASFLGVTLETLSRIRSAHRN